jgi:hypothetical protein
MLFSLRCWVVAIALTFWQLVRRRPESEPAFDPDEFLYWRGRDPEDAEVVFGWLRCVLPNGEDDEADDDLAV